MHAYIDFDSGPVFAIPARDGWHGFAGCEGMLLEGPQGWGEFSPPAAVAGVRAARYLTAAIEAGTVGWPDPVRGRVAVAVAVPAVEPEPAAAIAATGGCSTADVRVARGPGSLDDDIARVAAVRAALGPDAVIRCDAGGAWDVDTAVAAIAALAPAAVRRNEPIPMLRSFPWSRYRKTHDLLTAGPVAAAATRFGSET